MKLPELGENIEGGDVLRVMVKPGDAIKKDQAVLELETDKATIEVPSSVAGVVKEVKVKPGEKVKVGQTIFVVDENGAGAQRRRRLRRQKPGGRTRSRASSRRQLAEARRSRRRRTRSAEKRKADVVEMKPSKPAAAPRAGSRRNRPKADGSEPASIPAAPSARRLARELGVNIQDIQGSGPGGRISMDDVTAYARRLLSGAARRGALRRRRQTRCPTSASGERSSASR